MKVIFYDRKNKREVSNEDLVYSPLVKEICVADSEEMILSGRRFHPRTREPFTKEQFDESVTSGYFKNQNLNTEWDKWKQERVATYIHVVEEQIATLSYKSENCPKFCNHNLDCNLEDLIFLRLDE